jgi:hypothetical protein
MIKSEKGRLGEWVREKKEGVITFFI